MGLALERREGEKARKFAVAQYKNLFGAWPREKWNPDRAKSNIHPAIRKQVKNNLANWMIKKKYREGKAA